MDFVNRTEELADLRRQSGHGGLLVVFGRRRVGKTRLLAEWLRKEGGLYTQAIEAGKEIQLAQVWADIRSGLPKVPASTEPRSWTELFDLIDLHPKPPTLCIDEFPYLVATDPSLPSVLQRFLDHRKRRSTIVLAGSSTRMMHAAFLDRSAPLYGRARKILHVEPMSYGAFAEACRISRARPDSFTRFSMVGGIPRYWEVVERNQSPTELAEALFFGRSPLLEDEPWRLLDDEGISGLTPLSVLEAIGRGAAKPSEIAARLATAQTNLSRVLELLLDANVLVRELPFGESTRTTKRTLYRIADPTLRFWFRVYSPHRSRWVTYAPDVREKLIRDHAATVFEDVVRAGHAGAARYWEAGVELDVVRREGDGLVVTEVKWARLGAAQRGELLVDLERRFAKTALARTAKSVTFEVTDASALAALP